MTTTDASPIGLLGLGLMGRPVAVSLAQAGYDVLAWNRRPVGDSSAGGVRTCDSVAEVGRQCRIVLSLLPDLPQLEPLLEAEPDGTPGGLLADGSEVQVLVVMSTCSPAGVADLARRLAREGIRVADAPMSGGVAGAEAATLSIMVGASPETYAEIEPVLSAAGTLVRRFGDVGAGSLVKACNQLVVAGTLTSLAEALVLAERHGLDRALVLDTMAGGLAGSAVLDQKREALATDDFAPSGPARYLLKDLRFAGEGVGEPGLPLLPVLTGVFGRLVERGMGDLDTAAVLDVLRTWDG
jgi:2-hydroxy-3-oxopropionate reductase